MRPRRPDEVYRRGPLTIARFGRHVLFSNTATPEQQRDIRLRFAQANQEIRKELAATIGKLQDVAQKYDPALLLHRAAYMLIPLLIEHRSENEFRHEESLYLPAVEYVQYLVARTEQNVTGDEPPEDEWPGIWSLVLDALRLTQQYLLTRGHQSSPPSEMDELRFYLDSARLAIRVNRYPVFLAQYWRDSLQPYEQWIQEVHHTNIDDLIAGLHMIEEFQKTGLFYRYEDYYNSGRALVQKLEELGCEVGSFAVDQDIEALMQAAESCGLAEDYAALQAKAQLAFTPSVFDITDMTGLPKSLLSVLSVRPGEAILHDPTLSNYDDISPLSTSPLHFKPFLAHGDRFYFFYHSGFEDHVAEIIIADLLGREIGDATSLAKRYSDQIEDVSRALLVQVLQPDFALQRVFYPNPDRPGDLTELDIMLGVDDLLFLVEVKSGGLSAAASRGAPKSLASDLSALIIAGQHQSERAERYIRSQSEALFYDESGKTVIHRIRIDQYRQIFRVVVTREFLSWVGAKIAVLSVLDPRMSQRLPWHVSIDDLRAVAELFAGKELQFAHFLEQRLKASAETRLSQYDELEHIAVYHKMNRYHDLPAEGMSRFSFDPSYMKDIDRYFAARSSGESLPIPEQILPARMRDFLAALRSSHLPGRFETAAILLSMGQDGRNDFAARLGGLEERRRVGTQPSVHLPFATESIGLSISHVHDENFDEEVIRCTARMQQGRLTRWIVVQLADQAAYTIKQIRAILPNTVSEADLARGRLHLGQQAARATSQRQLARNERCPCGSGRKFKVCHGR